MSTNRTTAGMMANRSLAFRLSVNIFFVLLLSFGILSAFVLYRGNIVSNSINEKSLETRLDQIIKSIGVDESGQLVLSMPELLQTDFLVTSHDNIYIVKSASRGVLWTSHPELRRIAADWNIDEKDEKFVSVDNVFPDLGPFYGISREVDTRHGKFVAFVGQSGEQRDFARYILSEFMDDVAWTSPVLILFMVGTVIMTIRMSLRVLSQTSESAATIDPRTTNIRLPTHGLPREITPLVNAVNGALDRLEAGLKAERRFTANAAHELRTPLAVLKARVDKLAQMPTREDLDLLKQDVDRMVRVVAQLLAAARLEMPQPARRDVVLNELIRDVVAILAPLAMAKQQELAATLPSKKVRLYADHAELSEAVKNLVENAIAHCPSGAEIEVVLEDEGIIRVVDTGPGVPDSDKERIFERFFRGSRAASLASGAGLGLSIVRQIVRNYGGSIAVRDTPGGGATFVLSLPRK